MAVIPFQLKSSSLSHAFQISPSLFLKLFSSPYSSWTNKTTFSHTFKMCAETRAHLSGRASHAQMTFSGFVPTTYVLNCLMHMYVKCCDMDHAAKVFDRMPIRDMVSWNAIIAGYANNGSIDHAHHLFDKMPSRDTITWNSLISGYNQNENFKESLNLFYEMMHTGTIKPDRTTFAITLKSCAFLEDFNLGIQIHALVVKLSLDLDVVTGSALLDMYAKCGYFYESVQFFYEMPNVNWVTWSAIISGCVQNEKYFNGLDLFVKMQRLGFGTSQSAYASIFKSCASLNSLIPGKQIHAHALKNNYGTDIVVGTAIIDMYAKCNNFDDVSRAFWSFQNPTIESWNAMIVGFARNEHGFECIDLFRLMIRSNVGFNVITLSGVFNACSEIKASLQGAIFHCLVVKTGFLSNTCVVNAILDMYGKCKLLNEACIIFEEMEKKDSISWNAIITSLEQNGRLDDTLVYFNKMLGLGLGSGFPDEFTYGSVIKACAGLKSLEFGVRVHDKIIKSGLGFDTFVGCSLIDMYCKCGAINEALKLHSRIKNQDLVSWNAIISGFSTQNKSEEAQDFFLKMLDSGFDLKPDNFTYATVLDTCADLATIGLGTQLHAQILKQELHKDVYIASTLVDMYVKCGNMQDAHVVFDKMPKRDVVTWNAMICGYATHGHGLDALNMFDKMQRDNINPNHATFVSILRACGHVGLYNDGMKYFSLMQEFNLEPQLEHYSCMVDIIGRSKGPFEALKMIDNMKLNPDAVIWRNLLSVCKIRGGDQAELALAELAAHKVLQIDSQDSSTYILLCNLYSEMGKWEEVSRVRRLMRENGLKKEPGCSWIEVFDEMHVFIAGDTSHPRCEEIHEVLGFVIWEMKRVGFEVDLDPLWSEDGELLNFNYL